MSKIELKHPVEHEGATYTSITMRRPKAKDMIALGDHMPALASAESGQVGASVFEAMVAVISTLGSIPHEAALELDFEDLTNVATRALSQMGEADEGGAEATGEAP